jgi:hypothetical protein
MSSESHTIDGSGGKTDTIDAVDTDNAGQAAQADTADVGDDQGSGGGLLSRFRGSGEDDVDEADQEGVDENSSGLLANIRERFQDDGAEEPTRAELVDGANVLFVDAAANKKSLAEYDLVLITAPAYPKPLVLKNDVPIKIPEGSVLCSASSATLINYGEKRLLAKANILVPPDRADEVAPESREDIPESIVGKTIPERGVQDEEFYQLVLNGCAAASSK